MVHVGTEVYYDDNNDDDGENYFIIIIKALYPKRIGSTT